MAGQTPSISLTLLKHRNETFAYFNLKGKNEKSNEYKPSTPTAQPDNEHSANNTFIPVLPECCYSFGDHYELKIHLKFYLAGQNSSCHHIYRREMRETIVVLGHVA